MSLAMPAYQGQQLQHRATPAAVARCTSLASRPLPTMVPSYFPGGKPLLASSSSSRLQSTARTNSATTLVAPAQESSSRGSKQVTWSGFKQALGLSAGTALSGALVAMYIDQFSNPSCTTTGSCTAISDVMKALLVGTHLYAFLLIPAAMYVFYSKIDELHEKRARSPFVALLGMSFMMVAIMGEIGWHIQQDWYYVEEYNIQNLAFYFFLNSGLSAWAFGLRLSTGTDTVTPATPFLQATPATAAAISTRNSSTLAGTRGTAAQGSSAGSGLTAGDFVDFFLLATPVLTLALYGLGAEVLHSKVPIYVTMSAIFSVLTYRFWQVLRTPKVLLFPFFSVGVNLAFIALLNKYQADPFLNPLFHILHDAAGTEMGILIIAVLTYLSPTLAEGEEGDSSTRM